MSNFLKRTSPVIGLKSDVLWIDFLAIFSRISLLCLTMYSILERNSPWRGTYDLITLAPLRRALLSALSLYSTPERSRQTLADRFSLFSLLSGDGDGEGDFFPFWFVSVMKIKGSIVSIWRLWTIELSGRIDLVVLLSSRV